MMVSKNLSFIFSTLLLCIFARAPEIYADTHAATTCSYADVSLAVSAASPGGTVIVPSGSCTWASTLTITKSLNLLGAGIGITTIISGTAPIITYYPSDWSIKNTGRISGFTFNLNNQGDGINVGVNSKTAPFAPQEIRIDHNAFTNQSTNTIGHAINVVSPMIGTIDNNTFSDQAYPLSFDFQGGTQYYTVAPQNSWVLGSNDRIYVEDNVFNIIPYPGTNVAIVVHCQYSARYTFRYNTFNAISVTGGGQDFMDLHGSQGCSSDLNSMCSCFGGEVYGNEIITNSWNTKWFTPRGGKSLAFYNDYQGNGSPSFNVSVSAVSCPSSGYIEENMIHDTYFWGNRKNTTGAITPAGCDECPPYLSDCGRSGNRPLAGTDYFYDSSNPGVGCGTLANLPSSCTVGQGYWATNQSCSSLAGLAGKNPSTPISGTLYKCAATNTWTPYYQPYLYPHPLRMEQPTSPQNLRIVP